MDSFADGLLVLLSGQYTRLASNIVATEKEYLAWIHFGQETDTLCPEGEIVKTAPLPSPAAFAAAMKKWTGEIQQQPPSYSAIHINGMRASDRMRRGEKLEMPSRSVTISELECLKQITNDEGTLECACIRVVCSKGTYIRSLARDIALSAGSVAHLSALRRTRVGSFRLEDALGYSALPEFLPDSYHSASNDFSQEELFEKARSLSPMLVEQLGLQVVHVLEAHRQDFLHGKPLRKHFFAGVVPENVSCAVFCKNQCLGIINRRKMHFKYGIVFSGAH